MFLYDDSTHVLSFDQLRKLSVYVNNSHFSIKNIAKFQVSLCVLCTYITSCVLIRTAVSTVVTQFHDNSGLLSIIKRREELLSMVASVV